MITFIIPTIGRNTLNRSINSLLYQSNPNWKAIVVFDGIPPSSFNDDRIKSISINKSGKLNHAGLVRNEGIKNCDTEWIGFLDDDDTISKDYVERFNEEVNLNPDAKSIIFRMKCPSHSNDILPQLQHNNFILDRVGISFAMRKDLNLFFEPSGREDYHLLDKIRSGKNKMVISPYVTYFVRAEPCNVPIYRRVLINS